METDFKFDFPEPSQCACGRGLAAYALATGTREENLFGRKMQRPTYTLVCRQCWLSNGLSSILGVGMMNVENSKTG